MEVLLIVIGSIAAFIIILYAIFFRKKKPIVSTHQLPGSYKLILEEHVQFYKELPAEKRPEFENRVQHFLERIKISGVNTEVEDIDRVLIAASAIIPIFGFSDWEYINLTTVLLYPDSFSETFSQEGDGRTMLGIVGDGPYQNMMILSKHELRQGFSDRTGTNNTAIHEFVHLIDKTDGAVDGVPEFLLSKSYILPWIKQIREKIDEIRENRSDINPYGATNEAEFFAVVSEYFFERPDLLQEKHPELYNLLIKIFKHQPVIKEE